MGSQEGKKKEGCTDWREEAPEESCAEFEVSAGHLTV